MADMYTASENTIEDRKRDWYLNLLMTDPSSRELPSKVVRQLLRSTPGLRRILTSFLLAMVLELKG